MDLGQPASSTGARYLGTGACAKTSGPAGPTEPLCWKLRRGMRTSAIQQRDAEQDAIDAGDDLLLQADDWKP